MSDGPGAVELLVDRLVLDGVDLPADAAATFAGLIESELRRILDAGGTGAQSSVRAELEPIIVATPPDVPALARCIAERIAGETSRAGGWDG